MTIRIPPPTAADVKALMQETKHGMISCKKIAERRWRQAQIAACREALNSDSADPKEVSLVLLELIESVAGQS